MTDVYYFGPGNISHHDTQNVVLPSSTLSACANFSEAIAMLERGSKTISLKFDASALKKEQPNMIKFCHLISVMKDICFKLIHFNNTMNCDVFLEKLLNIMRTNLSLNLISLELIGCNSIKAMTVMCNYSDVFERTIDGINIRLNKVSKHNESMYVRFIRFLRCCNFTKAILFDNMLTQNIANEFILWLMGPHSALPLLNSTDAYNGEIDYKCSLKQLSMYQSMWKMFDAQLHFIRLFRANLQMAPHAKSVTHFSLPFSLKELDIGGNQLEYSEILGLLFYESVGDCKCMFTGSDREMNCQVAIERLVLSKSIHNHSGVDRRTTLILLGFVVCVSHIKELDLTECALCDEDMRNFTLGYELGAYLEYIINICVYGVNVLSQFQEQYGDIEQCHAHLVACLLLNSLRHCPWYNLHGANDADSIRGTINHVLASMKSFFSVTIGIVCDPLTITAHTKLAPLYDILWQTNLLPSMSLLEKCIWCEEASNASVDENKTLQSHKDATNCALLRKLLDTSINLNEMTEYSDACMQLPKFSTIASAVEDADPHGPCDMDSGSNAVPSSLHHTMMDLQIDDMGTKTAALYGILSATQYSTWSAVQRRVMSLRVLEIGGNEKLSAPLAMFMKIIEKYGIKSNKKMIREGSDLLERGSVSYFSMFCLRIQKSCFLCHLDLSNCSVNVQRTQQLCETLSQCWKKGSVNSGPPSPPIKTLILSRNGELGFSGCMHLVALLSNAYDRVSNGSAVSEQLATDVNYCSATYCSSIRVLLLDRCNIGFHGISALLGLLMGSASAATSNFLQLGVEKDLNMEASEWLQTLDVIANVNTNSMNFINSQPKLYRDAGKHRCTETYNICFNTEWLQSKWAELHRTVFDTGNIAVEGKPLNHSLFKLDSQPLGIDSHWLLRRRCYSNISCDVNLKYMLILVFNRLGNGLVGSNNRMIEPPKSTAVKWIQKDLLGIIFEYLCIPLYKELLLL